MPKNILFVYQPGVPSHGFYINPISWILKLYHETKGQSRGQWTWLEPVALPPFPTLRKNNISDQLVNQIIDSGCDILALSIYTWSHDTLYELGRRVKEIKSSITIVVGGPEVDGYNNAIEFYTNYPWIDWTVYSAGESSFSKLLDHLSGYESKLTNTSNNQGFVSEHEVFMDNEFMKGSPLLTYKAEIKQHIDNVKKLYPQWKQVYSWETVKGCPFKCSFCDWTNSGIGNKVRFWGKNANLDEPLWKKELRVFFEWDLHGIYWTNPNIGQTQEDEDLIDFWCELKTQNPNGPIMPVSNMSKTNKDRGYRLYTKMVQHKIIETPYISIQDIYKDVLDNIDRPDVPWEEQTKKIEQLFVDIQNIHDIEKYRPIAGLIWGLPGQTLDRLINTTKEVTRLGMMPNWACFIILKASPAANPDYQKKYSIISENVTIYGSTNKFVTSTFSLPKKEWWKGAIVAGVLSVLFNKHYYWTRNNIDKIADYVLNSLWLERSWKYFLDNNVMAIDNHGKIYNSPTEFVNQNLNSIVADLAIVDKIAA